MATDQEYAQLSDAVYGGPGNTQAPEGWTLIDEQEAVGDNNGTENGYYGAAFRNNETGEIVVANRGSRPDGEGLSQDWLGSDVQIGMQDSNNVPGAFDDSEDFARRVRTDNPGAEMSYTGHSLGGGEAQVQAARLDQGSRATTFGAPGTAFAVTDEQAQAADGLVTNYALPGDPVAAHGTHIGDRVVLSPSGGTIIKNMIGLVATATVAVFCPVLAPLVAIIALAGSNHPMGNYMAALPSISLPGISMPSISIPSIPRMQARMLDPIGCITHGAGLIKFGMPNVLVMGQPAARMGDPTLCLELIPGAIMFGSVTVFIGGQPAARILDPAGHPGTIAFGAVTVHTGG